MAWLGVRAGFVICSRLRHSNAMADGDRSAVPLTKMERMSSKLTKGAKRSMQAAAQVGTTVAESSLTAAATARTR